MRGTYANIVLAFLSIGSAAAAEEKPPPRPSDSLAPADEMLLLGVVLNGQPRSRPYVFLRRDGLLYARVTDLEEWRIRTRPDVALTLEGHGLVSLAALPGLSVSIDDAAQLLRLTAPAELFEPTFLDAQTGRVRSLSPSATAAFINYDVALGTMPGAGKASAFLEMGASSRAGLFVNTMTVGDSGDRPARARRLDTYYIRDDPAHLTRLVLSDTVTRATEWSRPIRFGGIRYGTDFGLQPGLATFPSPVFEGRTALPSNVELYMNNALRFRSDVNPGPFTLSHLPLITGAGEVTLVVGDALGNEHRVTTPYYVSSRLLRPGLSDYSIEIGAERRQYAIESFNYGTAFFAGSYRRGLTERLTLETRGEVSGDVQNFGAGFSAVWPALGEFGLAAAASNGNHGGGAMARAYFSHISPNWNVSASYMHASSSFAQIGVRTKAEQILEQVSISTSFSVGRHGSLGIAFIALERGDRQPTKVTSANYAIPLGARAFVNVFTLYSEAGDRSETLAGVGLTVALGDRSSAYARVDHRVAMAEYRRNPPTDQGWGYRTSVSTGDLKRQEIEATWVGRPGQIVAQAVHLDDDKTGARLWGSGGLILTRDGVHLSRRIDEGFAIVETPGHSGVRIYQDNRPVGRTNTAGRMIVTGLRAFDNNRISLAISDLPVDIRMQSDALVVTPPYRGGVLARFDLARDRSGSVLLRLPDGRAVEAGSTVQTQNASTFVGYDGEVFLAPIREGLMLEVHRPHGVCIAVVPALPSAEILPQAGPVTCHPKGERP